MNIKIVMCALVAAAFSGHGHGTAPLGLAEAVDLATGNEPSIAAWLADAEALQNQSIAKGQLPDPSLQLGAVNLPTDTFDLDQDPMTQLKVGVNQQFPAGSSREHQQAVYANRADSARSAAHDRLLQVQREAQLGWLEIYYGQLATAILRDNRAVLDQLRVFINSLYATGRSSQQDLTRLDVELSRLAEQEIMLERETHVWRSRLGQWLGEQAWRPVSGELPAWHAPATQSRDELAEGLVAHPAVIAMDYQVRASQQQLELSQQSYKPEWGVNLSYGHRSSEELDGSTRPDFLSAVVSVSMPLFRGSRQDRKVESSLLQSSATLNRRLDLLYRMRGELWSELSRARQYDRQIDLYQDSILKQLQQQAQTALQAYQSDTTDFSEVMRATLAQINGELDYQRLRIDRLKTLAKLRYYLAGTADLAEVTP